MKILKNIFVLLFLGSWLYAGIPTVTIEDDTTGVTNANVTLTFTFSEDVTGFAIDDIVVNNGTKSTFSAQSATVYTLVVIPSEDFDGNIEVDINADAVKSTTDEGNPAPSQYTVAVDTLAPTLTVSDNKTANTIGSSDGDVTFTFIFSESVTGFTIDDIALTGGTKGTFSGSGTTYTLVTTPTSNVQSGTIAVNVTSGAATDGLNNSDAANASQDYDTLAPSVTITDDKTQTIINKADGDVTFTFTFSEDVTGFTSNDITVAGGTKGAFSGSNDEYTLVVTPTTDTNNGTILVGLNADVVIDQVNQGNFSSNTVTQSYDTLAPVAPDTPTLTIDSAPNNLTNSDSITRYDLLSGVTSGTGNIETGATVQYTTDSGTTWQNNRPTADGTYALQIKQIDSAGNESPSSGVLNYTIDKTINAATPDLTAATDSGVDNTDNITNNQTPSFTGTREDGDEVTLYINNIQRGIDSGAGTTWSIDSNATIDPSGGINVHIQSQDIAGNIATSTTLNINIDINASASIEPTARLMNRKELQDGFTVTVDSDVEDGQLMGVRISGEGISSTLRTTSTKSDKFYIDFPEFDLQDGYEYNLTLSAVSDKAGNNAALNNGTIVYDKISDTSINSITTLTLNQTSQDSTLHPLGNDKDFYILTLPSRGYLSLASNNVNAHVSLHYYDDDFTDITDDNSTANVFESVLNSGTYYVKVYSGVDETYNLTPTFTAFDEERDEIDEIGFAEKDSINITTVNELSISGKYLYINNSTTAQRADISGGSFNGVFGLSSTIEDTKISTHTSNAAIYTYSNDSSVITVKDNASDTNVFWYDEVGATDFFIKDDYLYTVSTDDSMRVYDIRDDLNPKVVGESALRGSKIVVDDRYAYVYDGSKIVIVEILQDLDSNITDKNEHEILVLDTNISMNNYAAQIDVDVFKIILEKRGNVTFISNGANLGNDLNLSLYSDSTLTTEVLAPIDFTNKSLNPVELSAGTYYVKIQGNNNIVDGKYTLSTNYDTSLDSELDKVRNYISVVDDINLSSTTQVKSGNLQDANDVDLFKITVPYGGVIEANVSNSKNISLIKAIMTKSDDFSKEQTIPFGHVDSGVYFIKISGATGGDYDVSVKFTEDQPDSNYIYTSIYDEEVADSGVSIDSLFINKQSGEVVYVASLNGSSAINKYDIHGIEEHQNFEGLNTLSVNDAGDIIAAAFYEKHLYVVTFKGTAYSLRILDASKRVYEPILLSSKTIFAGLEEGDFTFDFSNENQLILKSSKRTYTIDISDKSNPTSVITDGGWDNNITLDGVTYSLGDSTGVDISSGGSINTGSVEATSMTTIGEYLYIGTLSQGIYVYNIENKTTPQFVRKITTRQKIKSLDSFGTKLFVVSTSQSNAANELLDIFDVSNDYTNYKLKSSTIYHETNTSGTVVLDDVDYFNLVLNATGDLNVSIDSNDINCTLSNSDDSYLQSCNGIVSNVPSGNYFIKLENSNPLNTTKYVLSTSQSYDDHIDTLNFDVNKKYEDETFSGTIDTTLDKDIFKLVVDEKSTLSINNLTAGFSAKVYYDGGDEVILNGSLYDIYKAGNYYIEISNATTTGNYSFDITVDNNQVSAFVDSSSQQNKYLALTEVRGDIKALKVLGKYIYLIDSVGGLVIYDITEADNPKVLNTQALVGQGKNITVDGNYVYVAQGEDGIEIFDVSDRSAVKLIGQYNTAGNASDIVVDNENNQIYIADGTNGVVKLNISDPSNPVESASLVKAGNDVASLLMYDDKLYVADSVNGLRVYENDVELTSDAVSGEFKKIIRNNNYLYAVVGKTLRIYDISSTPTFKYSYDDSDVITSSEQINNIAYIDDLVYIMTNSKIAVVDVADPTNVLFEKQILEIFNNSGTSLGAAIVNTIDNSADNLFYGKLGELHILEISPDYVDVFKDAQEISSFPYSKKGQIVPSRATDKDVFKLTTKYSGKLSVTSSQVTLNGKVSLYSQDANGMATLLEQSELSDDQWNTVTPLSVDDDNSSKDFNISNQTLNQGTFYLVVEDVGTTGNKLGGNYELNVDFNTTDDAYADIIDDAISNPVSVDGGVADDSLFSGGGDKDFIDISIDSRVNLTFTLSGDVKPRITLFYPDNTQMNMSTEPNATTFTTEISEGDYKVRFDGFNTSDEGDYKIALSTAPIEDILVENGLSKIDIDKIVDVNYLGNNIYVATQNGVARYTHLVKELTNAKTNFVANDSNVSDNTNYQIFTYTGDQENKIVNYVVTTRLDGLQSVVSTVTMDTLDTQNVENVASVAPTILPYLKIEHISQSQHIYMYDGSTLLVRKLGDDNVNMESYSFSNLRDLKVVSNGSNDLVYLIDTDGGYGILEITTDTDGTLIITPKKAYAKVFNDIGALYVDSKNDRLYMSVNDGENKLIYYDISNIDNIVRNTNELSFTGEEFEGLPSDLYVRDKRIYALIPAKGVAVIELSDSGTLSIYTSVLNLGKDIDNIYSMDGRTLNYTNVENNTTRLKIYFFEESFQDGESDGVYTSLKEGNEPQEGCFIATAAYGSYFESHVKVLREFRDSVLMSNALGREFTATYYEYSPPIANYIATNESLKVIVRVALTPIVYMIQYPLYFVFGVIVLLYIRRELKNKKGVIVK